MLHTRVIVRGRAKGDVFFRYTEDRGAKFRDEVDIARVTKEIIDDMAPRLRIWGEPVFKIDTTEAG